MDRAPDPWRPSASGVCVALRVTPRGGHDGIDGVEILADGRRVIKIRVRAVADGGAANRAVMDLMAKALAVPKARLRLVAGMTSRLKQIAINGDPAKLGESLRRLTAAPNRSCDRD